MSRTQQPQQPDVEEENKKERDARIDSQNIEQLLREADGETADLLEKLMQTELSIEDKNILANLVDNAWALANFSEAEVQEIKADLIIIREKFLAMHPGQESHVTGMTRAWAAGDNSDNLEPLTDQDRIELHSFINGAFSLVTRAKDFGQQEILSTQISEVRRDEQDSNSGGLLGVLK